MQVASFARDHADVPKDLGPPRRPSVGRNGQQLLALDHRLVIPPPRDIELNLVDGEIELASVIAFLLEGDGSLVVGGFSVG